MIAEAVGRLVSEISVRTAQLGRRVTLDPARVLDRSDSLALSPPGRVSPNGSCRLLAAQDGWLAVNLAREADRDALPAWLCADVCAEHWEEIAAQVAARPVKDLIERGRLLALPVAAVGEILARTVYPRTVRLSAGGVAPARLNVLDLSALWAGPLCASVFAEMGADVLRLESVDRPENGTTPHYRRLNGAKRVETIEWGSAAGDVRLRAEIAAADVVITSARRRAFAQRGLDPFGEVALKPHAVWVAVSGYGWTGDQADRVAFGDDAAAAGGLVARSPDGAPSFLGDALADPITGLAAAVGALRALADGGGVLVDAVLACCAAGARADARDAA